MRTLAAAAVAIAAMLGTAAASPPGMTRRERPRPRQVAPKSTGTAVVLAALGTLGPAAMVFGSVGSGGPVFALGSLSLTLTPSAGHWYAGEPVTWGMGLRAAGAITLLVGLGSTDDCDGDDGLPDPACDTAAAHGRTAATVGGLLLVTGVVLDLVTAGNAVERWNRAHTGRVAATVIPTGSGYGLALTGTF